MHLEINPEFRKRKQLQEIIYERERFFSDKPESYSKAIDRWTTALGHPRNFSDFETNINWIRRWITEEPQEIQLALYQFLYECLGQFNLQANISKELMEASKVLEALKTLEERMIEEWRKEGLTEEKIQRLRAEMF